MNDTDQAILDEAPEEECIHYGVECDDPNCPCFCGDCPVEEE